VEYPAEGPCCVGRFLVVGAPLLLLLWMQFRRRRRPGDGK